MFIHGHSQTGGHLSHQLEFQSERPRRSRGVEPFSKHAETSCDLWPSLPAEKTPPKGGENQRGVPPWGCCPTLCPFLYGADLRPSTPSARLIDKTHSAKCVLSIQSSSSSSSTRSQKPTRDRWRDEYEEGPLAPLLLSHVSLSRPADTHIQIAPWDGSWTVFGHRRRRVSTHERGGLSRAPRVPNPKTLPAPEPARSPPATYLMPYLSKQAPAEGWLWLPFPTFCL